MFRFATLVETLGSFLEVRVQKDGFNKKTDAETTARNMNGETSMGSICFYDEREPREILDDFARTYQTAHWISDDDKAFIAQYSKKLTIIPLAFVNYFSGERSLRRQ